VPASELEKLLRSRRERELLGARAREHCVGHFSRDAVVDRIVAYYEAVAGRSAATHPAKGLVCA